MEESMSDLIDRQAAIDAICGLTCGPRYGCELCIEVKRLINLPSAQPEIMYYPQVDGVTASIIAQPEIIRCKDCKHRILNENYGKKGRYMRLKAMCDLDTGDPFQLGRSAEDDDWYCADAERRTDE